MEGTTTPSAAIDSASPPAVPSWLTKSIMRYDEDDDIQFSLPSGDDGAFFSLHFGQTEDTFADPSPHKSTFDRINEELGYGKTGSGLGLGVSPRTNSGLCLTDQLQEYSHREEAESYIATIDKVEAKQRKAPAIVGPPVFKIGDDDDDDDILLNGSNLITNKLIIKDPVDHSFANGCNNQASMSSSIISSPEKVFADSVSEKLTDNSDNKQLGIFSRVKNYFLKTEPSSPTQTPQGSPAAKRKISTPVAPYDKVQDKPLLAAATEVALKESSTSQNTECTRYQSSAGIVSERNMSYNAYFYRPNVKDNEQQQQQSATTGTEQKTSSDQTTSEAGTSKNIVKRYRPKPSQLREMNFWAPTSM